MSTKAHLSTASCARKTPRDVTECTLLGARSVALRLVADSSRVLHCDVVSSDRASGVVTLRPWGFARPVRVALREVCAAVPSICPTHERQRRIAAEQRELEASWPS